MLEALKFVQNTAVLAIERLIQKADPESTESSSPRF